MAKSHWIGDVLAGAFDKENVELKGWVIRTRSSGKIAFISLRDSTGVVQCVARKNSMNEEEFLALKEALIESAVVLRGVVNEDERSPEGREIQVTGCDVISPVDPNSPYPITESAVLGEEGSESEFLLDNRHLDIRSSWLRNNLKIRSDVLGSIHSFFRDFGFIEFQAPNFVSGACEGGSTLFEVPYFGRKAFLTQSWQLYAEAGASALERIYCVAPSFRAEKSRTRRHLTEFWHAEMELAWSDNNEVMTHGEKLIKHIAKSVLDNCRPEIEANERDVSLLEEVIENPFPRLTYTEAVERLQNMGEEVEWGQDLDHTKEQALMANERLPIFITDYPAVAKPFYHRLNPDNQDIVMCHDLLAPEGYGEVIGGGERTHTLIELEERMDEHAIDRAPYEWYIDIRRFGGVPHAGFGLGVDRVVAWLAGAKHIREVIPFPRTSRRVTP